MCGKSEKYEVTEPETRADSGDQTQGYLRNNKRTCKMDPVAAG